MENTQETPKQRNDPIKEKWNYLYGLVNLEREKKDIRSELTELCSVVSSMASESSTLGDYLDLANLHYHCTEHLLRRYGMVESGGFPDIPESIFTESR